MAFIFGKSDDKKKGDYDIATEDEILGYLDEVQRKRSPLTVLINKKDIECSIYGIDDEKKLIRMQNEQILFKYTDKVLSFGFSLDRTWFTFKAKLKVIDDNIFITYPHGINHNERRKFKRVSFNPREEVKVTIVENLGSGTGTFGTATDISQQGITSTIDKAMLLATETVISPHADLYKPGTKIMMVRVNKVPGGSEFETEGIVNRVFKDGPKWKIALELPKIPSRHMSVIKQFVDSRSTEFKLVSRSRLKRLQYEEEMEKREVERPEIPKPSQPVSNSSENRTPYPEKSDIQKKPTTQHTPLTQSSAQPAEPDQPQPEVEKTCILSIGQVLKRNLIFLSNKEDILHVNGDNLLKTVTYINEYTPKFICVLLNCDGKNSLEYLQKISTLGVLEGIEIILFSDEEIPVKEKVKCRMLNINHIFTLPLQNHKDVLDLLRTDN